MTSIWNLAYSQGFIELWSTVVFLQFQSLHCWSVFKKKLWSQFQFFMRREVCH